MTKRGKDITPEPGTETRYCSSPSCSVAGALACAYSDSEGHSCLTAWCMEHVVEFHEQPYCVRHANTLAAIGEDAKVMPALDDRAPSLAHWLGSNLGPDIRYLLDRSRNGITETLFTEPVRTVGTGDQLRWQRRWRLATRAETTLAVGLTIHPQQGPGGTPTVALLVNDAEIHSGVPPWIGADQDVRDAHSAEGRMSRRHYLAELLETLISSVEALRPPPLGPLD